VDVTRQFTDGDVVWGFLQLDDLLIDKVTFFVDDKVGVQGTGSRVFAGLCGTSTCTRQSETREASQDWDVLRVLAVATLDVQSGSFGGKSAGSNDDSRDTDQIGDVGSGQAADQGLRVG
jgi:hypothetical protein